MRTLDLGAITGALSPAGGAGSPCGLVGGLGSGLPLAIGPPALTTIDLDALEWDTGDDGATARFLKDGEVVATFTVRWVDISYYAKQHLLKQPQLLECGVVLSRGNVDKLLIPTGRSRMAGNGSVAVKYYDITRPIRDDASEQYERVGIRPPSGVFTYAFFEAQYLARSEDSRRGALFLIDPRMIIVQYPMTDEQKNEFQTFGGKKVLYFDVLDAPNLQEREEEIKRCRIRGDEQKKQYEEADRKWEEEMEERLRKKAQQEADKPKLSKKAKQKARQAEKQRDARGARSSKEEPEEGQSPVAEAEEERMHKQKQAEVRARAEEEARREREAEVERKKLEAAEIKRQQEEEEARMKRVKNLLQKVQSSIRPNGAAPEGAG